jgi:hypothetical protein
MKITFSNIHKKVLANDKLSNVEKEKLLKEFIKDNTGDGKRPTDEKGRVALQTIKVMKKLISTKIQYEKYMAKGGKAIDFLE